MSVFHTPNDLNRDRHLRRRLLVDVGAVRHMYDGYYSASSMFKNINGVLHPNDAFQGPDHAVQLLRSLVDKGYLEERITGHRQYQKLGIEHLQYRITAKGQSLLNEEIPADAGVEDQRSSFNTV